VFKFFSCGIIHLVKIRIKVDKRWERGHKNDKHITDYNNHERVDNITVNSTAVG
jgi:hypothetical protein